MNCKLFGKTEWSKSCNRHSTFWEFPVFRSAFDATKNRASWTEYLMIRRELGIFANSKVPRSLKIFENPGISQGMRNISGNRGTSRETWNIRGNPKFSGDSKYVGKPAVSPGKSRSIFGILKFSENSRCSNYEIDYDHRFYPDSWYFWILACLAYFPVLRQLDRSNHPTARHVEYVKVSQRLPRTEKKTCPL